MATRTTGAEWNKFYTDSSIWKDGTYHEDEEFTVDGAVVDDLCEIKDQAKVTVSGGIVYLDGREDYNKAPSLEAFFKRWRKTQMTAYLNVEVDKTKLEAVMKAIITAGGKIK